MVVPFSRGWRLRTGRLGGSGPVSGSVCGAWNGAREGSGRACWGLVGGAAGAGDGGTEPSGRVLAEGQACDVEVEGFRQGLLGGGEGERARQPGLEGVGGGSSRQPASELERELEVDGDADPISHVGLLSGGTLGPASEASWRRRSAPRRPPREERLTGRRDR